MVAPSTRVPSLSMATTMTFPTSTIPKLDISTVTVTLYSKGTGMPLAMIFHSCSRIPTDLVRGLSPRRQTRALQGKMVNWTGISLATSIINMVHRGSILRVMRTRQAAMSIPKRGHSWHSCIPWGKSTIRGMMSRAQTGISLSISRESGQVLHQLHYSILFVAPCWISAFSNG